MRTPQHVLQNSSGMSLVEVTVGFALMLILGMAMMGMQSSQRKANNYIEFQMKRAQLQGSLVGQFLNDPNNCKCLFAGASPFPTSGAATLSAPAPSKIGRYNFTTPGVCGSATMPRPLIDTAGSIDGLKLASVQVKDIMNISGVYEATLSVSVQSMKEVSGPGNLLINIPVAVSTVPGTPGNVAFNGCSTAGAAAAASGFTQESLGNNGYVVFPNGLIIQWGRAIAWNDTETQVNFNIPFTTAAYSVTLSGTNDGGPGAHDQQDNWPTIWRHSTMTTINHFWISNSNGADDSVSWIAIGK